MMTIKSEDSLPWEILAITKSSYTWFLQTQMYCLKFKSVHRSWLIAKKNGLQHTPGTNKHLYKNLQGPGYKPQRHASA